MQQYKLQEEELLASFRPDAAQNRQQQPQGLAQPGYYAQPQQFQHYAPNQLNQPPSNPQLTTFIQQDPNRVNAQLAQGQQQAQLPRANSPQILISYNEMQRGVSPQQGSIVTQVYKPINQQPPPG